jgi:hypothetical protein
MSDYGFRRGETKENEIDPYDKVKADFFINGI